MPQDNNVWISQLGTLCTGIIENLNILQLAYRIGGEGFTKILKESAWRLKTGKGDSRSTELDFMESRARKSVI